MRLQTLITTTTAALALVAAGTLNAQSDSAAPGGPVTVPAPALPADPLPDRIDAPPPAVYTAPEPIRVLAPTFANGSPIHGGWITPSDAGLLAAAGHALDNARDMNGSTVTMVANNGHLAINGSAASLDQAYRIEQIARNAAGGNSVAFIDVMGG